MSLTKHSGIVKLKYKKGGKKEKYLCVSLAKQMIARAEDEKMAEELTEDFFSKVKKNLYKEKIKFELISKGEEKEHLEENNNYFKIVSYKNFMVLSSKKNVIVES